MGQPVQPPGHDLRVARPAWSLLGFSLSLSFILLKKPVPHLLIFKMLATNLKNFKHCAGPTKVLSG